MTPKETLALKEHGRFQTPNGSKYLQQMCKHFSHKAVVAFDERFGTAALPPGPARMRADAEELCVEISAGDTNGLRLARAIIDDHLKRFAFRENFDGFDWQPSDGEGAAE